MADKTLVFPDNFLWGTATAGYQYEGNSRNADFWAWEQGAGHIQDGGQSGPACDWWDGRRWQEDFDRAAADGHGALRLSVEWSRIEPSPGRWDDEALDHYRQMLHGLRQRGLTPMVTLHHYVNPLWVAEQRALETGEFAALFGRYARKVAGVLGEYASLWCTFNEPNAYVFWGWLGGAFPPGKKDFLLMQKVARNVLLGHAAAYHALHAVQPQALVSLPIHFVPFEPANPASALDRWAARQQFGMLTSLFPDAIRSGAMRRLIGRPAPAPEARGTIDFFGIQYYTTFTTRFDLANPGELFGRRAFPPGAEVDDAGFYASYPPGFLWSLRWASQFGLPIYVTENGIGDEADKLRPRYLIRHLRELRRALDARLDIRGYFHWSLVDNFEWQRGWAHRFGLYALDRETQLRTPRASAGLYAEICRARALSAETVARFAPDLVEEVFAGRTGAEVR